MTQKQLERKITKELQKVLNNKKADWLEWGTSEEIVKSNLREGEKYLKLEWASVFVAYKESDDKRDTA